MKINMTSVMVDDQEKALAVYTDVLGFVVKHDIPLEYARYITVVSPDGPEDIELLLEPNGNPAVPAREWQKALYDAGIPATSFGVDDVQAEYEHLKALGVRFTSEPASEGGFTTAIFDDTCGNLIMIVAD
jgi:catechol 2,3-dioxygenase-like lactoylglutathione lyase family enzyme